MSLYAKFRRLTGADVLRDVLRLVSGTLGGRLIAVAAMPLATRLYSPDDFALLAVYMGAVYIGAAVACLRFDIAIPVALDDKDAVHLVLLALLVAFSFAASLMIAALAMPQAVTALLGQPRLAPWLWMIPVGVLMAGSYSALQYSATRIRRFGSIAITRITQAVVGAVTLLVLGWAGIAPFGLLLGNMLSATAGSLRLGREVLRSNGVSWRQISLSGLINTFRQYRRFPIYSTPEALANIAGTQVPIMIVAAHAGAEAGYLLLAQQVMALPMALLGSSIGQVYVSRAPEQMRKGNLAAFTSGTLWKILQVGAGPLILGAIVAPHVFPAVFGPEWARAGEIMIWMLPWTGLQLLASPVSMVLHITKRQRTALVLQIIGFAMRVSSVLAFPYLIGVSHLVSLVVSSAIFYMLYLCVIVQVSKSSAERDSAYGLP